ncbi:MAG: putative transport protein [Acidimicrobiia bacterium]|nr:putative transport protein [Acidimicrobiia bacterium]
MSTKTGRDTFADLQRNAAVSESGADATRWVTLAILVMAAFIVVIDNTILNLALPTILRDFHTTLPHLEWVVTGYALTFATLLIIGGRLGDLYGHRRVFIVGASLFALGSLIASASTSVNELILGEAVVEGIGAALMMPATLSLLSALFRGKERATAFGIWGATLGAGSAFGPVIGGFLTTNYSWRWAFRINVIIAPLTAIGAFILIPVGLQVKRRVSIDVPGALLVMSSTFLMMFGITQGTVYGWFRPLRPFTIAGHGAWPTDWSVSVTPLVFFLAIVSLTSFVMLERWKERTGRSPLVEIVHFRLKTYRYGIMTGLLLSMGQIGVLFSMPLLLQNGKHLSAQQSGFWLLPSGISVILGSQLGSRLAQRFGPPLVVRTGFIFEAIGIAWLALSTSTHVSFLGYVPGFIIYGGGLGAASAQLTSVVLSEIPDHSAGVASGASTTGRQIGNGLGVAVMGALVTVQTVRATVRSVGAIDLPTDLKARALTAVHQMGPNFAPPSGVDRQQENALQAAFQNGLAHGVKIALIFATCLVTFAAAMSFKIPRSIPGFRTGPAEAADPDAIDAAPPVASVH